MRGGAPIGLSVKRYIAKDHAWSFTVGRYDHAYWDNNYWKDYRPRALVLNAHYLWQQDIPKAKGLMLFYGPGGQIVIRQYGDRKNGEAPSNFALGLSGVLGVEYFIPNTPLSVFGEIGPYVELFPAFLWIGFDYGGGIRVNF